MKFDHCLVDSNLTVDHIHQKLSQRGDQLLVALCPDDCGLVVLEEHRYYC